MSRYNLNLIQIKKDECLKQFEVLTSDFRSDGVEEKLGVLDVDVCEKTVSFVTAGIWSNVKVVPISVFSLPVDEAKLLIRTTCSGAQYTDWIHKIYIRSQVILKELGFED